jgi:hypothetical protein
MKRLAFSLAAFGCASWLTVATNGSARAQDLPPEPKPAAVAPAGEAPANDENVETLTRGPVHEAFAQAVTPPVEDGLVIDKQPPEMIEEIPPSERPEGDNIAWIPGYWGWDDERKDFIWISGIWRAMPPGREWVPGYWTQVDGGHKWIPGYWADATTTEVQYLPPPPETVDAGPNTQPPTGDEIWIPGCWVWQDNRYVWRAGYWAEGHQNWIWTNAHYCYTPRGYVYIPGYWDYTLANRGILYAPAYFRTMPRGFVYSPRLVVNTGLFVDHLFLRPTYRHYYFGDFYAANYRGRGILPWFVFHNSRYGFDPIYSYNRWRYRDDRDWARRIESRYENLRDREDGRPPRTFADWQRRNRDNDNNRNALLTASVQDLLKVNNDLNWRLNQISDADRRDTGRRSRDLDEYRQQRMKLEADKTARRDNEKGADTVRLLKPPISNDADARPNLNDAGRDLPGRENRDTVIPPGRDNADRPGRDNADRPGRDDPGRNNEEMPDRDRPRLDTPQPERPERPDREDRPQRPDRPERPGITPRPELPMPERPMADLPVAPPSNDEPVAEPRDRVVPKAERPTERGTDPRDIPREAPKRASDLPGPLNDPRQLPRNPRPGDLRDTPAQPDRSRDIPGPLNDPRSRSREVPRISPRIEREIPKTESPRTLPSPPDVPRTPRDTPRAESPRPNPNPAPRINPTPAPRVNPGPGPGNSPRVAPSPRPNPQPAAPRPNRGGGGEGKGGGGNRGKGD